MRIGARISKKDKNLVFVEIENDKGLTFSRDKVIANFLGISEDQYLERMEKTFKNSFIFKSSTNGWYVNKTANRLSLENVIDKFKEEFLIELTTKSLV